MAPYFKLPHPYGPQYDPAVVGYQKPLPPKASPPTWTAYPPPTSYSSAAAYPLPKSGKDYPKTPGEEMREVIPELFDFTTSCPMGLKGDCDSTIDTINLYRLIQHLNDEHKWSREEIADWLDSLEVDLTFKARGGDHADEQDSDEEGG